MSRTHPACERLRQELQGLSVRVGSDTKDVDSRIFPKSRLKDLLLPNRVLRVLQCCCVTCSKIRKLCGGAVDHPSQRLADKVANVDPRRPSYILVLAILLHIRSPQLIWNFVQRGCSDSKLESDLEKFSSQYVQGRIWPKLLEKDRKESSKLGD